MASTRDGRIRVLRRGGVRPGKAVIVRAVAGATPSRTPPGPARIVRSDSSRIQGPAFPDLLP